MSALRILLIEDSADDAELIGLELQRAGYELDLERVETAEALEDALARRSWEIILADYSLPSFTALDALKLVRAAEVDTPFIVISGKIGEDVAVDAMKLGVDDYVMKDKLERLAPAVARELRLARARHELAEQRRQLEIRLRTIERMTAIGRMASGLAHDFNNVLMVIQTYTDSLLDRFRPGDPVGRELQAIVQAIVRGQGLSHQLLTVGGRQPREIAVLDLRQALDDLADLLARLLGQGIELKTQCDGRPCLVDADLTQIEQIVMNLAINARDAMPDGGVVRLEVANVTLADSAAAPRGSTLSPGDYVTLRVVDTGVGMDAETLAHVFEPFYTTKGHHGSGLGLSTVYGIVDQSRGFVAIDSTPGAGTSVEVWLPRSRQDARDATPSPSPVDELSGTETLLLVEDEVLIRAALARSLTRRGYDVLEASNAGEALLVCEQHEGEIRVMVTDVAMPRMSGPDLAARLSTVRPKLKVVYMSGYSDPELDAPSKAAFIQKPFSITRLLTVIRALLDAPN